MNYKPGSMTEMISPYRKSNTHTHTQPVFRDKENIKSSPGNGLDFHVPSVFPYMLL